MKKLLVLFAIAFLTLSSLAACAPKAEVEEEPTEIGRASWRGRV